VVRTDTVIAMDPLKSRKRRRKLLRVIGLVIGAVLGWWAGAKLTGGPVGDVPPERLPATRPAPALSSRGTPRDLEVQVRVYSEIPRGTSG
jgi:hypothetical protein